MTNINPSDCNYPENFWVIDNNGMTILLMGVNYICHSDDLETQDDEIELVLQANQKLYAENSRPLKVHNLNMCDLMIALYGEEWEDSIDLDIYTESDRMAVLLQAFGENLFFAWENGIFPSLPPSYTDGAEGASA